MIRDIEFSTFMEMMKAQFEGLDRFADQGSYMEVWINNVKCEIKNRNMTFAYNLSGDETEKLRASLTDEFTLTKKQPNGVINVDYVNDTMEDFIKVCHYINNLDIATPSRGRSYNSINENGLFNNIATVMKTMFDTGMTAMMNRGVFDSVDHIVALNAPLDKDSYREHIVPCVMIIEEAFRMFDEDDASILEVAAMIQQNLFIVHITKAEADYLDHTLGLKTTMPLDWNFGDSVFARLDAAKINY